MNRENNTDFDKVIERRGTDSLKYDCAERRGKAADILPMWVADMDFQTSSFILEALKKRAEHGIFGYTEAGEAYHRALESWLQNHHGLKISEEWVVKTPGVVFALAMAVRAFTDIGDPVLIQQPVYYPFSEVIRDNGRSVVSSDLVLKDGRYEMDFVDFENRIRDEKIKLFILCSPHNPVGRVWTDAELKKICDICLKYGVILVSDEIHEDFVFPGHKHIPALNADPRIKESVVICTSPSKTFNLAGLQLANILIPSLKLRTKFKKEVAAAGYSQQNSFGIEACRAAYESGDEWHRKVCEYIFENLCFMKEYLAKKLPKVRVIEPEGTYLIWMDFNEVEPDYCKLSRKISEEAGVWLDDGAIFGKCGEGFERINIAVPRTTLEEGLARICSVFEG